MRTDSKNDLFVRMGPLDLSLELSSTTTWNPLPLVWTGNSSGSGVEGVWKQLSMFSRNVSQSSRVSFQSLTLSLRHTSGSWVFRLNRKLWGGRGKRTSVGRRRGLPSGLRRRARDSQGRSDSRLYVNPSDERVTTRRSVPREKRNLPPPTGPPRPTGRPKQEGVVIST